MVFIVMYVYSVFVPGDGLGTRSAEIAAAFKSVKSANEFIDQKKVELEDRYSRKNVVGMFWEKGKEYGITRQEPQSVFSDAMENITEKYYLVIKDLEP